MKIIFSITRIIRDIFFLAFVFGIAAQIAMPGLETLSKEEESRGLIAICVSIGGITFLLEKRRHQR